ncbi:MAG: glycosyltransferase family 39 protein [Candidatus Promineifilaceae bacterium]
MDWIRNNKSLTAILVLSVILRIGVALYFGNDVSPLPGITDQISYHTLAQRIVEGHGFTFGETWWPATAANTPTAHWSFLYVFFLTAIYKIVGPSALIARLLQAIIVGILHPYLAYRLGKTIFNKPVGLVTAGITAVYTYFVYYAAAVMTEAFYITAILIALNLLIALSKTEQTGRGWPRIRLALFLGLVLGAVVLLRQLFLLVVPFLFLWLWWNRYKNGRKLPLLETAVPIGIIILMIIPFTIFNYSRFDRFVLLNTNAGYAFYWGNHPIYGTHFISILPPEMGTYRDLIPAELRRQRLDEAALDQELLRRGIGFVTDDPVRYILLSISRIPAYFVFWPSADSGLLSNLSRLGSFTLFLPFMLYGLILSLYRVRGIRYLQSPEALLLLFALLYTAIHLLTWALIRYRLPVDAVMIVFAGSAVVDLWERFHLSARFAPKTAVQQG